MAKKSELGGIDAKLDRIIDTMIVHHSQLNNRIDELEHKFEDRFDKIMISLDRLTKSAEDLLLEYAAVKIQLARHEEWIRLIAKKAGVKLPSTL